MLRAITRRHICALATVGLLVSACSKDAGTKSPGEGKTQAQIDAEREGVAAKAQAEGLIELANKDLESGRYVSARKRAEEALEKNPENADAYAVLGAAAWRAGEFEASNEAYRKALELDPKNFGAAIDLGRNLQAAGKHADALALQETVIATESEDFDEKKCNDDGTCDMGWCDTRENMCKPPMQVRPRLTKLWSQYLLLDVPGGVATVDEIFLGSAANEDQLAAVRPFAEYLRALEGKGDLITVEGDKGVSDLQLEIEAGYKHISSEVGGEYSRTVVLELLYECRIHTELAETLKLEPIGKVTPFGGAEEQNIVLIPEIKVGDMVFKNTPALVQDLEAFGTIGETPGLVMGRQLLHRLGAVSFDFPKATIEFSKAGEKPAGASELPLLMIDLVSLQVPAVRVSIDGSEHAFWAWWGGIWKAGLTVTRKHYLKSDHRPSEVDPPDDPNAGLKMIFVNELAHGEKSTKGLGGYVLTNTPPDAGLEQVLGGTSFELGGYLNLTLIKNWRVTYAFPDGKIYVENGAAAG